MGSRILFIAGPQDMKELNAFIRSLGLYLVPPGPEVEYSDDEALLGRCYISPMPAAELRVTQKPPRRYTDVLDPIISFTRSIYLAPFIRPGDIYWNNDVPALAVQTKPFFQKIARWIRQNWPKPEGDDWHFGPEAKHLVFEEGIEATSMVPGVRLNNLSLAPE